jgi:hypothetical protein
MTAELPWEVKLLLAIADEDLKRYELYIDCFADQFKDGLMSEYQFRRFVVALGQIANRHKQDYENLKKLAHKANNPGIRLVDGDPRGTA